MSTVAHPTNPESDPRVKAVFDDIRATRGSDFINNLWHYLAFDPALLESVWRDVKAVMATPGSLDPLTKELITRRSRSPTAARTVSIRIRRRRGNSA
jgi:alkylhydroperoxidase family enzyme